MTLQQLEYVLALEKTRHFVRAAELCGVTQPTLSAMIQKLEDELDCKIFDRSRQPIEATEIGKQIIRQAQVIIYQANQLKESVKAEKNTLSGTLNLFPEHLLSHYNYCQKIGQYLHFLHWYLLLYPSFPKAEKCT